MRDDDKSKKLDEQDKKRDKDMREAFKEADKTDSVGIAYFLAFFVGALLAILVSCSQS